ncbi:MAG: phosphate acyltransferase PlsX [Coriobacteriia bacterium]|nr:phosphate acyltransferase PlsX [Coriobacteriia bacterium]
MAENITVSVDALGGDNAPDVVLEGTAAALAADPNLNVILCGPADVVEPFAASHDRCQAQVTTEFITMGEHPAQAVRKKKDSSLVVGCRLVKEGQAQGFFSAGSTGACLAAGTLVIGRIKGVKRPCLCTVIPSPVRPVVMCDVGANADCKPDYLVQFARMGAIYAERVIDIKDPRVALLNIGEEEEKGSEFAQQCHALLRQNEPNFVGNAEGRDILEANFDVFVTDGFTGNVTLKTIEGTAGVLLKTIKGILGSSLKTKIGALCIKDGLMDLKQTVSADTYGGAPLLGVKGACIVGHGSSNATAIKNGIAMTARIAREDVVGMIGQAVSAEPAKAGE